MSQEVVEENLLRSIEQVDVRIQAFRKRVRALLAELQSTECQAPQRKNASEST